MFFLSGQTPQSQAAGNQQTMSPEQLDSLVALIAVYPDSLLAQVLAALTYLLQIVTASRWVKENSNLQGKASPDAGSELGLDHSARQCIPGAAVRP
jgi:hypothetical protein